MKKIIDLKPYKIIQLLTIYTLLILDPFNTLLILIKNKQELKKINIMMKFQDLKDF